MLAVACAFVFYALGHPEAGGAIEIFGLTLGAQAYWCFYIIYIVVMLLFLILSFLPTRKGCSGAEKKKRR
jgi:hypothetical protein